MPADSVLQHSIRLIMKGSKKTRITASGDFPAVTQTLPQATSSGIRTEPVYQSWRTHTAESVQLQRERVTASRFLQDAVPLIGYIIEQLAEEAIGDGLSGTSDSKDPEFKAQSTELFALWAESTAIDTRKRLDFYRSQTLIAKTMMGDGELFATKVADNSPYAKAKPLTDASFRRLQIQFLLRDQIGNGSQQPYIANGSDYVWDQGIKFNYLDQEVEYRIPRKPANASDPGYTTKSAAEVMHIFSDRTFSQHHGTPWLFRGHKSGLDAMDLHAVRKFGAKIQSMFLGAIHTKDGMVPESMKSLVRKGTTTENGTTTDNGMRYLELAGGVVIPLFAEGQTMSFFQGREAISFPQLMQELWSEICLSIGAPPEYLINIAGLGSASVRMVIGKIKKLLNRIRRPVRDQFCQPVWEFVIGDAIAQGKLKLVEDWKAVTWLGGGIDPSIDAGRDEKAEQAKLINYTGTREAYCANFNLDGNAVGRARVAEVIHDIKAGLELAKAQGLDLPWQLFVPAQQLQAMSGVQAPADPPPDPAPIDPKAK